MSENKSHAKCLLCVMLFRYFPLFNSLSFEASSKFLWWEFDDWRLVQQTLWPSEIYYARGKLNNHTDTFMCAMYKSNVIKMNWPVPCPKCQWIKLWCSRCMQKHEFRVLLYRIWLFDFRSHLYIYIYIDTALI